MTFVKAESGASASSEIASQPNHRERRPGGVGDPLHLLTLLTPRAPEPRHQASH